MTAVRLDCDLGKVHHNAATLVERLAARGVAVTGVTKAALGWPDLAECLVDAGVARLGDARIENVERMRAAGITTPITLIRSPLLSEVDRVVEHADVSCNTEDETIQALAESATAQHRTHGVLLMVELGDLREGILPGDVVEVVRSTIERTGVWFAGIGANLGCQHGVLTSDENMGELSRLARWIERRLEIPVPLVSGGSSGAVAWATETADGPDRVDDLRLGEAVLLGREPSHGRPIDGLHQDAFTVVAEVIESKGKPSEPWGDLGETTFADLSRDRAPEAGRGEQTRSILALGHQDTDPWGLEPPAGIEIVGASSDHLVVTSPHPLAVGAEVRFQPAYSALVRAMASPSVTTTVARQLLEVTA
jgi:ornithine racemase